MFHPEEKRKKVEGEHVTEIRTFESTRKQHLEVDVGLQQAELSC